jgi:hypothetical protein
VGYLKMLLKDLIDEKEINLLDDKQKIVFLYEKFDNQNLVKTQKDEKDFLNDLDNPNEYNEYKLYIKLQLEYLKQKYDSLNNLFRGLK